MKSSPEYFPQLKSHTVGKLLGMRQKRLGAHCAPHSNTASPTVGARETLQILPATTLILPETPSGRHEEIIRFHT